MKNPKDENNRINRLWIGLFWLALWQAVALIVARPLLLPGPWDTVKALWILVGQGDFYLNVMWTMGRCIAAMSLSFITGAILAWVSYQIPTIRSLLTLPVAFFKAVPVMAIIIYVILLAKADVVAVAVCFLMCFPVVYTNMLSGLDSVEAELLEVGKVYRLTTGQRLRYIYMPAIRSQVSSALTLIAGLSWKAVVAAEVLSVPAYSLGYEMVTAKYYLETPSLFAYIGVIVALSLAFEKILSWGLSKWQEESYNRGRRKIKLEREKAQAITHKGDALEPVTVSLEGVSKAFGSKSVISDLTASFEAGSLTVLMGSSGKGKTTLGRIAGGLTRPDKGQALWQGSPQVRLSLLFQEDRLMPWLSARDNMALALLSEKNLRAEEADQRIEAMADCLELGKALDMMPHELSGGMKHRVALGRAFLAESNLMILDEPLRGLDGPLKKRIIDRLWDKVTQGKTVIVITHSREDALLFGGEIREV